jgi:hypothetical protein
MYQVVLVESATAMKEKNNQEHHNPPKWWVKEAQIPFKDFYKDPQHRQKVKPKYHKFVNSFYGEMMEISKKLMPKEKVIWVETKVIKKEDIL